MKHLRGTCETETPPEGGGDGNRVVRKRGGQPGNCNRLRHGRYSKAVRAHRAEIEAKVAALLARCAAAIFAAELAADFRWGFAGGGAGLPFLSCPRKRASNFWRGGKVGFPRSRA